MGFVSENVGQILLAPRDKYKSKEPKKGKVESQRGRRVVTRKRSEKKRTGRTREPPHYGGHRHKTVNEREGTQKEKRSRKI